MPDKIGKTEKKKKTKLPQTDLIQSTIGNFGIWQLYICLLLSLIKIPVAWHQLAIVFLAPPTDHWCLTTSSSGSGGESWKNVSFVRNGCKMIDVDNNTNGDVSCSQWEYDKTVFTSTIIMEWNLVCDKAQLANVAQLLFMFGVLLGNLFFGMVADKYGRKIPLIVAIIFQIIAGVATAFVQHYSIFLILRFVDALAVGGQMITSFVICMEIVGQKWRTIISVLYHLPFSLGHSSLPLVAYYLRDWRYFQLAISLPSLVFLIYWWIIPESPRWLIAVGRKREALPILKKAIKRNKLSTSNAAEHICAASKEKEASEKSKSKGNFLDLFRTPQLRKKTLCISFNWFVCGIFFFGIVQYMGQVGGDIFINVAISGLMELPGTFGCIYVMDKFGRRNTLAASQLIAGISCLSIMAVPLGPNAQNWPKITLSAIGILGMSVAFPTIYLFSGELFPTVVRNVGVGSASMCARIGSMIAPFITSLNFWSSYLPPLVFGLIPLIGCFLCFFLPETVNTVLPDTIEEGENFGKYVTERYFPSGRTKDVGKW